MNAIRRLVRKRIDRRKRSKHLAAGRTIHRSRRLAEIRADLAKAEPGFVFIAGDSHAELLGRPNLGRPVVNGGIGAQFAIEIARVLPSLTFNTRARASFVIIGQNDTLIVNGPFSFYKKLRMWYALRRIILFLKQNSDLVIFSHIPPYHREIAETYDRAALRRYANTISRLCAKQGCLLIDGFEDVRSGDFDLMLDAIPVDAAKTHLMDYGQVCHRLRQVIDAPDADGADHRRSAAGPMQRPTIG